MPRPAVMGIVNVTPDSFSDGGRYVDAAVAIEHGLRLVAGGADVLDVGGESTRPGAEPVPAEEEIRRVVPVIAGLASRTTVPISVDTMKAPVAEAALVAGATIVNDVSAGLADPGMLGLVARAGAGYVVMHMRGTPRTMQDDPRYDDVVAEVTAFLQERVAAAEAAGISRDRLLADPGIGFGKTAEHNLQLLRRLDELVGALDPVGVLVGTSRKRFLGGKSPADREEATLATVVWALDAGAAMVRVHDVVPSAAAVGLLRRSASEGAVIT